MGWHQSLLPLVASRCETAGCVLPTRLSPITPTMEHDPGQLLTWCSGYSTSRCVCVGLRGPSTKKVSEMDDDGWERESRATALGSSWQLGQTRRGVKPSLRGGTDQSTNSACSCQTQQAFSDLLWWWDRSSLLNTSGRYQSVCCGSLLLTSFPIRCARTHTHNGFFVGMEKCSTGSCTSQNTALFASQVMMDHCGEP